MKTLYIQMGEFESLNFSIGILPEDIALFHSLYRTSIKGRKHLVNMAFCDGDDGVLSLDGHYTSRVIEVFMVTLKSMGISVSFDDEDEEIKVLSRDNLEAHELNGTTYLCSDYQFFILQRIARIREQVLLENPVITAEELDKKVDEILTSTKFLNGEYKEDIKDLELNVEAENERIFNEIQERKNREESAEIAETLEKVTSEVNIEDV